MADVEDLARRAVATVSALAQRAASLATAVALFVGATALVVFLLGLVALDAATRSAWVVVGGALVIVAVGAPLLARWRLTSVRRDATALVGEVRTLIERNTEARRIVIDTVEAEAPTGTRTPAVVVHSTRFGSLRDVAATANDLRTLPSALTAVTTFPWLLAISVLLLPAFFVLGLIFLIALLV